VYALLAMGALVVAAVADPPSSTDALERNQWFMIAALVLKTAADEYSKLSDRRWHRWLAKQEEQKQQRLEEKLEREAQEMKERMDKSAGERKELREKLDHNTNLTAEQNRVLAEMKAGIMAQADPSNALPRPPHDPR
jgi:O6-methylguanine-DNA--protein-cysteine methyltransferase